LPYKKTPSMKIATVEVVPPNIRKKEDIGAGISTPIRDNEIPDRIEIIRGFFESFFTTVFNPSVIEDFSSLYNSRTVIESVTLTGEIEADDNVANCSPCAGKANIINGIPKKDRLPKIVLRISR
jgi:hypothetical protein